MLGALTSRRQCFSDRAFENLGKCKHLQLEGSASLLSHSGTQEPSYSSPMAKTFWHYTAKAIDKGGTTPQKTRKLGFPFG